MTMKIEYHGSWKDLGVLDFAEAPLVNFYTMKNPGHPTCYFAILLDLQKANTQLSEFRGTVEGQMIWMMCCKLIVRTI